MVEDALRPYTDSKMNHKCNTELSVIPSKKSCLIKVMFSIIEFITSSSNLQREAILSEQSFEGIVRIFRILHKSVSVQTVFVLHLHFKLPFLRLPRDLPLHLRTSKREHTSKSGNLEMFPSW